MTSHTYLVVLALSGLVLGCAAEPSENSAASPGRDASSASDAAHSPALVDASGDGRVATSIFRASTDAEVADAARDARADAQAEAGSGRENNTGCGLGASGCGEQGAACCDPWPCDGPSFCHGSLRCCQGACRESCTLDQAGTCDVPCTGAAPNPSVATACRALRDAASCGALQTGGFPSFCVWLTGAKQCDELP